MTQVSDEVTIKQKEHCAIVTMRMMLALYAEREKISFADAMFAFANTPVYNALFDFESGMWREGPRYLLAYFDEYLQSKSCS